jgi:hypothetical protein
LTAAAPSPAPALVPAIPARRKLLPLAFFGVLFGVEPIELIEEVDARILRPAFNLAVLDSRRRMIRVWRGAIENFQPGEASPKGDVASVITAILPPLGIAPPASVSHVASGRGTAGEIDQTASWQRQADAAHEQGPQSGVDARNAIIQGQTILATLQGQGGRQTAAQMEQVHSILDQIVGFLSSHSGYVQGMDTNLQDIANRLAALEQNVRINRTSP